MALRPCARPGCVNLVRKGYCETHRALSLSARTEAARPSAHKRGYTREWARYSKTRLQQHPVCEGLRLAIGGAVVINEHPGVIVPAVLTDHVVPHKGDMTLFWDGKNHQSACKLCHDVKTAKEDGGFGRLHTGSPT